MNETELIRGQLALEQQRARAAGDALAARAPPGPGLAYLGLIERRWRARAEAHARRLEELKSRQAAAGVAFGASLSQVLGAVERASTRCRDALKSKTDPSEFNASELMTYVNNIMSYLEAVAQLDSLAASRYGLPDWRAVAHLDADAMLEERRLFGALDRGAP